MDLLQTIILALIQGISEFLPISSSAHLILPAQILGWPDQGLAFDVAVHIGSLLAVLIYFRKDVMAISGACLGGLIHRGQYSSQLQQQNAKLGWMLVVATLPAVIVALFTKDFIEQHLRSMEVIAVTTILFGALLGVAELKSRRQLRFVEISFVLALIIGIAQALALIPGTSRSGITITVAVLLGLSRSDAARFSFLMSIPIIMAAGLLLSIDLLTSDTIFNGQQLFLGVLVSGVSAWLCITTFLKLIERIGFLPFVWYRFLLGGLLIWLIQTQSV